MKCHTIVAWGCLMLWAIVGQAAPMYTNHLLYNTDPVIHWRLDELVGTVANDAAPGGPYNGAYQSTYTHGVAGPRPSDGFLTMNPGNVAVNAYSGNGPVRYTALTDTAGVATGSYSYQMWFNSSVASWTERTLQYLFTRGNGTTGADRRDAICIGGNWLSGTHAGKLVFVFDGASNPTSFGTRVLDPNRWYHLAFVRNDTPEGGNVQVYLNGKLEIAATTPWQGGTGNQLTAGNRTDGASTLGFYGPYDEVAVWNRPLGEAEAKNLYYDALGSPYLASVLRKDPAAYWRLEETTGTATAYDFTGNGRSFTYHAAPTRTGTGTDLGPRPAEFGGMPADNKAPTLTGQPLTVGDGYLGIVSNVLTGQNDYSAEMWFRPGIDTNPHGDYLLHRGTGSNDGDYLGLTSSGTGSAYGKLYVFNGTNDTLAYGGTTLTTGEWYHVGMTRSGNDIKVYLNGLPTAEISTSMAAKPGLISGQWALGGRSDTSTQQKFSGNIDEVAVYGAVLGGNGFQENYLSAMVQRDVPYAKTTLSFSPESYWRLDEVSPYTLAVDATGHGHTFTYSAGAVRTGTGNSVGPRADQYPGLGADNNAPRLAATTVGIVDGVLAGQNDYSAQMWFLAGDSIHAYGHYLLHRGTGSNLGDFLGVQKASDKLYIWNGSGDPYLGATPLTKGEWYHLAMTREGSTVKVYLNGQQEISATMAANTGLTSGLWAIGGRTDITTMNFTGNVDEVSVFGRSLSKFHVQASYLSALARDECDYSNAVLADTPAAYWRLNEGSEWVAAMDSSGNAHHFEYQASPQRGSTEMGPTLSGGFLGFEAGNTAPRLVGGPTGSVTNGYLGIATGVLPGQNDYTAEMWFRRDAVGSLGAYLLHRNDLDAASNTGDYFGVRPGGVSGEINLFVYDGGLNVIAQGSNDIEQDEWYHVAFVREANDVSVYLNGQLEIESTMNLRSGTKWVDGTWAFGGRTDILTLSQRFAGSMDEIAIYDRALSHEEIRAHYLVGVPEPSTGLLLALACLSLAARRRRK